VTDSAAVGVRVALVHDWLNQLGGAENVLEEMVALFPGAPIHTSIYASHKMPAAYRGWPIRTSFMQRLPGVVDHHQAYLPVYPLAFGRTDLSGYDLVVSNKSGFCHGVRTANPGRHRAVHVCYCLTPTRYLWLYEQYREREQIGAGLHLLLQPVLAWLRRWDWAAAQRVDHFVAISREVQQRIRRVYGRDSVIIHPPVDTERFRPDPSVPVGDYYLMVNRLIPYKRIDLAIQAFARLPQEKLVIVGEGRDRQALEAQAGPNVTFLGRQSGERTVELVQGCRALVFPGLEDFGIAPLEALSAGRPVIAYGAGGALDTVVPGVTGEFFASQTVEGLEAAVSGFDPNAYDPRACRDQAEKFSRDQFRRKLRAWNRWRARPKPVRRHEPDGTGRFAYGIERVLAYCASPLVASGGPDRPGRAIQPGRAAPLATTAAHLHGCYAHAGGRPAADGNGPLSLRSAVLCLAYQRIPAGRLHRGGPGGSVCPGGERATGRRVPACAAGDHSG
jgi:glycosyltransferase involved in cell wall biosynthesis